MHAVIVCALFFIQLQLKFIECAYGNDYRNIVSVNNSKQDVAKQKIDAKNDNSNSVSHIKLNKRYPNNSLFIISSAFNIIRCNNTIASFKIISRQPLFTNHFKYSFTLRGPPSAC